MFEETYFVFWLNYPNCIADLKSALGSCFNVLPVYLLQLVKWAQREISQNFNAKTSAIQSIPALWLVFCPLLMIYRLDSSISPASQQANKTRPSKLWKLMITLKVCHATYSLSRKRIFHPLVSNVVSLWDFVPLQTQPLL